MSSVTKGFSISNASAAGYSEWFHRLYIVFVSVISTRSKVSWVQKTEEEVTVHPPLSSFVILIWDALMCLLGRFGIFIQVAINCLAVAACGMTMAFPAVALPALTSSGHTISPDQVSMVGFACYVMILIGSFSGGLLSENSGRRKTLLTAVTNSIVGWIVAGVSESMIALVSGLLFLGIGMGLSNSCTGVYLTELVSSEKRRVVSAAKGVAFSLGITLIYVLGFIIRKDWRKIALISSAIPASALLLGIVFLRESSVWMRQPKGTAADKYFCGIHQSFWSSLVKRVEVYRFFYPFNTILILFQLSGATVLITFAVSLLDNVKLSANVDPYILAIGLGLSHMVGPVLAELFSLKWGPRRTLVYSATFMSLSILFLARLHRISGVRMEDWPPYIAEAFASLFICTSSIFTSVTASQQEKIFPVDVRRACSSMTTFNSWIGSSVAVVTYPVLAKCLSLNDIFMIYATCCVLCAILTIMLLPEVVEQSIAAPELSDNSQQLQLVTPPLSTVKMDHKKLPPIIAMGPPKVKPPVPTKAQSTKSKETTKDPPPQVQPRSPSKVQLTKSPDPSKQQLLQGQPSKVQQTKPTESSKTKLVEQPAPETSEQPTGPPPVRTVKTQVKEQLTKKLVVQEKELPQRMEVPKVPSLPQVQPKNQQKGKKSPKEPSKASVLPKSAEKDKK